MLTLVLPELYQQVVQNQEQLSYLSKIIHDCHQSGITYKDIKTWNTKKGQ